jgi:predicted acetyltransferase
MTVTIRQLDLEESIKILYLLNNYAFRPTPPLPDYDAFAERLQGRNGVDYHGVFEDDEPQAIGSAILLRQNIRGQIVPMGGVANVATHPAARRRGYVRALMHKIYEKFAAEEIGVSCLYPFKETFYQRLGYVTLPQAKIIRFDPKILLPTLKMHFSGIVDLVSYEEHREEYRQFIEKIQQDVHGMALFTLPQTNAAKESAYWLAVAKKGVETIGMMRYSLKGQILDQLLSAPDFLFLNNEAKYLLLNWIARHIDQASKVELTLNPNLMGEILYTDIRPQFEGLFVAPMARVTNITSLNGIPCGEGEINIKLVDPDCDWNNGYWRLTSMDDQLKLSKDAKADCTLTIQGLTGLIYGVYRPDEIALRGWGEMDPKSEKVLERMFPPAIPFLHAMY